MKHKIHTGLSILAGLALTCAPAFAGPEPQAGEAHDSAYWTEQGTQAFVDGRNSEAVTAFRNAVAASPDKADLHYHLGVALEADGHIGLAQRSFAESLKLDPTSAQVHISMAGILAAGGQSALAERQLRDAIGLNPVDPGLHHHLGLLLLARGKPEAAAAEFGKALTLNPRHGLAQLGQGKAWLAAGEKEKGEQAIKEATADLGDESVVAFDAMVAAWTFPAAKTHDTAPSRIDAGLGGIAVTRTSVAQQSPAELNRMGLAFLAKQDYQHALGFLTLAVERAPHEAAFVNNLACAQAALGYGDLSGALFESAAHVGGGASAAASRNLAWMKSNAGKSPSVEVEDGLCVLK